MRPGLPTSIVLHAAVLGWALVSFAATPPLDSPAASDPIDVELLPPSATTQQKQGDKTGKPSDAITKDTKVAPKDNDGKKMGDTKTEEPPPPPPEQKPTPPAEKPQQQAAVQPPEPKPEPPKPEPPKLVTEVKPTPPPPTPAPKPDLPKEADKAKEVGVGKPPEVKEPPKDEKALEKLLEQAKKPDPKPPEKKPDPAKPAEKPTPKTDVKLASNDPKQASAPSTKPSQLRGQTTDILNHVETGTATSRTPQRASLGNPNGPNNPALKLSQSELEGLIGMLKSQISKCWSVPPGASESGVKVTLTVMLNVDGTLSADPNVEMVAGGSNPQAPSIVNSAKRAVKMCASEQPFKLPADKYAAWAQNHITFDPAHP